MEKEVNGYLQKPDSSKTCNIVKLDESNKSLITELKINKSLQKVKITALLSNLDKKTQPPDATIPGKLLSMLDELGTSDIDSLVPTHDERGCSIPEWKRQVMVRKLEAHLASEEGMGMKGKECCALEVDDWQYSQAHNAILGPYGELLTGDDLLYLEKQVEKLQVKRKCQEYKSELECLTDELQTVFPNPTVNITVNHKFLEQGSEEAIQEVSAWCSHMSGVVKGTALLFSKINGMKKEGDKEKVLPKASMTKSFSGGMAKREILECGVSVKDLRGHFEKEDLEGLCNPFELQELKTMSLQLGADGEATSPLLADTCKSKKPLVYEEYETGDMKNPSDSGISYEEASSEATKSYVSTGEASTLQKERIVLLFLSHWKKSAYAPSLKLMVKKTLDAQQSGKVGLAQVMAEVKKKQAPMQKPWMDMSKLGHLVRQRDTTKTLISHWKDIISLVPSCQIRHLNHQHTIYSPEQFLPYINGEPLDYNSLTLDLFMLGYFHILELDLSPEERKARHLLCFEVFDHLGSHQWETVCAFHKAVTDEIAAGKRSWKDSFEDIKIQFFGNSKCPPNNMEPKRSPVEKNLKLVSKTKTPNLALERQDHISGKYFELGTFDSDEICSYFDRSFAFWKEREAEIFRFDELGSLH